MKDCMTCLKFPCERSRCCAVLTTECEYWWEAQEQDIERIQSACFHTWVMGVSLLNEKFDKNKGALIFSDEPGYYVLDVFTNEYNKNEELIHYLEKTLFWIYFWCETSRGGHYRFKKPKRKRKYKRRQKK